MSTLQERIAEVAKDLPRGWKAQLARHCNVSPPSVSDWTTGQTKTLVGSNLLKASEFFGVHPDWLASGKRPKYLNAQEVGGGAISIAKDGGMRQGDITIQQYQLSGSAEKGLVLEESQPGLIHSWCVDHDWLRLNAPRYTATENLFILTGFGSAMKPLFNPGDPLLMDSGITDVKGEGVYFIRVANRGLIRQLQHIPGENGLILRAKSLNPTYDSFDITPKMDFECFGKILKAWHSSQF
jgi:phage repressor protein C with HTH and peptisase S24 domain